MTRNQNHTKITDHEGIAHSRQGIRSPKILPQRPDQPAKPFESTTDAFANALLSAKPDETNAQIEL